MLNPRAALYATPRFLKDCLMRNFVVPVLMAALMFTPSLAHEYYLEPDKYEVALGEEFGIAHKNGMRFKGNAYPWIGQWNVRSEAWQNGVGVKVFGKDGDRPALKLKSDQTGLVSIIHQSNPSALTFTEWEKFKSYLADEGLEHIEPLHIEKGFPKSPVKEVYSRFAKTLINVGSADDVEKPAGLKIELLALANPARLERGDAMPVQLLWDGKPLPNTTVKVFAGIGTDEAHRLITNAKGQTQVPDSGPGPYLLNAVHMREPLTSADVAKGAHWESFWASMTFSRN